MTILIGGVSHTLAECVYSSHENVVHGLNVAKTQGQDPPPQKKDRRPFPTRRAHGKWSFFEGVPKAFRNLRFLVAVAFSTALGLQNGGPGLPSGAFWEPICTKLAIVAPLPEPYYLLCFTTNTHFG